MTKYICSKASECKAICFTNENKEHDHQSSCNIQCQFYGAPPDAVCIPVPELVICDREDKSTCWKKCPHKERHLRSGDCFAWRCSMATGKVKCVPYPLAPKEDKPLYIIGMHGLALDICDLYDDKSAHEEAFKLAEVHPGRKVYLLEAKEYCIQESQPVIWREVK